MKKLLFLTIFLFLGFSQIDETKFNNISLQEVKQDKFINCKVFTDSTKQLQIYELKMALTGNGLLIPEDQTILSDYILFPIDKKKISLMTQQDIDDITTFINSIDLAKRKFK